MGASHVKMDIHLKMDFVTIQLVIPAVLVVLDLLLISVRFVIMGLICRMDNVYLVKRDVHYVKELKIIVPNVKKGIL